jgi:ApaG protein
MMHMPTATTHDIKISVETAFQDIPKKEEANMFAYRITIENHGENTIKLLRRHWYIVDILNEKTEVEGEGVVGLQPIIEPGESHQYVSGCAILSDFGKMFGTYLMEKQLDGKQFEVIIPEFQLIVPNRLN